MVSILITTFNHEAYINEAIDSCLSQTYKNIELVIGDDCSSDNTQKILKNYENFSNVRVFKHQKRMGATNNTNFLIERCRGDYILFFSGDDLLFPSCVEIKLQTMLNNENTKLVFDRTLKIDASGNYISHDYFDALSEHVGTLNDFLDRGVYVYMNAALVERQALDRIRYPANLNGSEFFLLLHVLERSKNFQFYFLSKSLSAWRRTESSYSLNQQGLLNFNSLKLDLYCYIKYPTFRQKSLSRVLSRLHFLHSNSSGVQNLIFNLYIKIMNIQPLQKWQIYFLYYLHLGHRIILYRE